jgi:hypothetical protein
LKFYFRYHEFDQRRGGVPKHGTVRKLNDIPRSVQPVRPHYKVNESRISPSLRQDISGTNYNSDEMSVTSMESLKEKLFDICIVRWF